MNETYIPPQTTDSAAQTFKAYWLCFLLLLVALPFSIMRPANGWALTAVIFLSTLFFLSYWLRVMSRHFVECRRTELDVWFIAYAAFFTLSASQTEVPYAVFPQVYRIISIALFFAGGLYACEHRPQVKLYIQTLAFAGGAISLMVLLRYSNYFLRTLISANSLQTLLGFYQIALPISLGYALAQRDRSKRTFFIFLCLIMGVGFLSLKSRSAAVCLGIGLFALIALLNRRGILRNSNRFLAALAATAVIAFFWYMAYVFTNSTSVIPSGTVHSNLLSKNFWLGLGPAVSDFAANDYLRLWTEGGLVLTIVTLVLFIVAAKEAWFVFRFQYSKLKCAVAAGYLASLLSLALHGLFRANFHTPAYTLLFWSLTGLVFSLGRKQLYPTDYENRILKRIVVALCVILMVLAAWLGSAGLLRWMGRTELEKGDAPHAVFYLNKSISINPFNAESYYWRGAAKKKTGISDMATQDFKKAVELNPYNPRYFWLEEELTGVNLETARDYYYSAEQIVRSDPRQNPMLEQRMEEMLHLCLRKDESYGEKVSELLWSYYADTAKLEKFFSSTDAGLAGFVRFIEKNDMWRFHRRYLLRSLGTSIDGVEAALAEHLWTEPQSLELSGRMEQNGSLKVEWDFAASPVKMVIHARGTPAADAHPQLLLRIDNVAVDSFSINSTLSKPFETVFTVKPGYHVLSLEFVNDYYSPFVPPQLKPTRRFLIDFGRKNRPANARKEDRNLWIEKTEVSYAR